MHYSFTVVLRDLLCPCACLVVILDVNTGDYVFTSPKSMHLQANNCKNGHFLSVAAILNFSKTSNGLLVV